jgi:hypothetical protein
MEITYVVEDENAEDWNELTSQGDFGTRGIGFGEKGQSKDIYSRSSKEARIQEVTTYILKTKELLRELKRWYDIWYDIGGVTRRSHVIMLCKRS